MSEKKDTKNWVKTVKTESVDVPPRTMTLDAKQIAKVLLEKNKRPGAHGSIIRFIQFHINRGGKGLKPEDVAKFKRAQEIIRKKRDQA